MATNSVFSHHSIPDQELIIFLTDILKTTQLLKEKISLLAAKYPVTAREKSLDELVDKLQKDIQGKLDLIRPPPSPSPSPVPSELSEESIPSPVQEVTYSVDLYDDSMIRRRTINNIGNLGQSLPRKKKVKETINVEMLTNDKYDPEKRALTWVKSKEYSTLVTSSIAESEQYITEGNHSPKTSNPVAQAIVIDVGKLNFKTQTAPFFIFDHQKHEASQGVFSLKEHTQNKSYDHNDSLETGIKIARANYEYWSSLYYRGLSNKDKDPMQRELVKEYLRCYVKDPMRSRGVIYFYQVKKILHNRQLQSQVFIGRSDGPFEETLAELHQNSDQTLLKLALQSHVSCLGEDDSEMETKNIVFILDFGYTEAFFDKYKDRLDRGDRLVTLKRNYVEYFGTRSPIGLN